MNAKNKIDPVYYDTHDFTDDLIEAKNSGELIVTGPGESARDAINRYLSIQKNAVATKFAKVRRPVAAAML